MAPKKPTKEPRSVAKANLETHKESVSDASLEAIRKELAALFFQKDGNPWVNGLAIGFLPNSFDAIIGAKEQDPELLVFVNPSAPDCNVKEIRTTVAEIGMRVGRSVPAFSLVRTSRFVGLAQTGDSISPQDLSRYDVSPFSTGTLGCFVEAGGTTYILGSNHVIAHNGRVPPNTKVVGPGLLEDPTGGPIVGSRSYFSRFQRPGARIPPNRVDYAVAELMGNAVKRRTTTIDPLEPLISATGQFDPKLLLALSQTTIRKYGRTTLDTTASVTLHQCQAQIDFTFGTYTLEQMFGADVAKNIFAAPGDSGALAFVDDPNAPAALKDRGIGLITARAYTFDPSNKFVSYIILMCSLDLIADDLAGQLHLNKKDLKFFI
jgi:hypothetical protein